MARIRTIKPEFWQNEQLASVSLHARLLAIALLNFSDDEGYFLGNSALVRASCFPFDDDSSNVRRSLDELSKIGYVELRDCSGKVVGRVCNFGAHQKIDRPQKSKLSSLFCATETTEELEKPNESTDSANTQGTIDECSTICHRLEQGKEQGKEQGTGKGKGEGKEQESPLSLSSHGKDPAFKQAWNAWIRKQAAKSGKMDPWTEQGQLKELERFAIEEAIAIVEYSTSRTNCVNLITNGDHKKKASGLLDSRKNGTTDDGYFLTDAQKKLANTKKAMEDFVNGN